MTRSLLPALLALVLSSVPGCGPERPDTPTFPTQLELGGDLAARVALTERRLQSHPYDPAFVVQDVVRDESRRRRFEEYEGDVSGRLLGAWSTLSRLTGRRPARLDSLAELILRRQTDAGWFGLDQRAEGFDFWGRQNFGHGRLLVGLVQYARLSGDQAVLRAAEKLGDYFVATVPLWTTEHAENPWSVARGTNGERAPANRLHFIKTHQTSVLEGLMMLYALSPKPDYLETGKAIVALFPEFGHFHAHSFLNTLVGVTMLYRHTGEPAYLDLVLETYWRHILPHGVPADGGIPEWFPDDGRTEGCSITDWVRLNLALWEVTRDAVYLDQAERAWLNALNFHQTGNGAFGHAHVTPTGYASPYSEAWWCCLMHGLVAYSALAEHAVAEFGDDLWVNFYTPLSAQLRDREIRVETAYPAEGDIRILPRRSGPAAVHLRIPGWADGFEVRVNGDRADAALRGGYAMLSRTWSPGDTLSLRLPISFRAEDSRGNALLALREPGDDLYTATLFHGPLLLGLDTRHNDAAPDHLTVPLRGAAPVAGEPGPFTVPGSHYRFTGLYGSRTGEALLAPLAEHTGYAPWTDTLQHFVRNGEEPIQRVAVQTRFQVKVAG